MSFLTGLNQATGITVVRLVMGAIVCVAGYMKWAGGIENFVTTMTNWGLPMPGVLAPWVGTLELVGGAALFLGLLTRWFALYFMGHYLVALLAVKWARFGWNAGQIDMMLIAGAILLLCCGGGPLAADRFVKRK